MLEHAGMAIITNSLALQRMFDLDCAWSPRVSSPLTACLSARPAVAMLLAVVGGRLR